MKAEIIVRQDVCLLVMKAETDFEEKMLAEVGKHTDHRVEIRSEQRWGIPQNGSVVVTFETKPKPVFLDRVLEPDP
jgi:hypothetical protein